MLTTSIWLGWIGGWLDTAANPNKADAVVILGGSPERLVYGVDLYRQQMATELWVTGDAAIPSMPDQTYGAFARQYAVDRGVPATAVRLLQSTSTWTDGQAIAAQAKQEQASSLLVVTDWYHGGRALCAVRRQFAGGNIVLYFAQVPIGSWGPDNWWHNEDGQVAVVNELIKRFYYWREYSLPLGGC